MTEKLNADGERLCFKMLLTVLIIYWLCCEDGLTCTYLSQKQDIAFEKVQFDANDLNEKVVVVRNKKGNNFKLMFM